MAEGSQEICRKGNLTVIRISQWNPSYRMSRVPLVGRHTRATRNLIYSRAVRNKIEELSKQVRLDIVEYADIEAEGFSHTRSSGLPYVIKLHTPYFALEAYYSNGEFGFSPTIIKKLEEKTIRRANAITSPSRTLASLISEKYELPSEEIRYIPNGIDTGLFSPSPASQRSKSLVLYAGRLERLKGADTFMRAIPTIAKADPQVEFLFLGSDRRSAGGGSQKEDLRSYLAQHGVIDRVGFVDHSHQNVFLDYYRKATVCVVPSLFENCPYTLLEAMACGKPVVASDNSGLAEIVRHEVNGLLFETGSSDSLAKHVLRLLDSSKLRLSLGEAARQFVVERHDANHIASLTENLYLDVLGAN